VTADVVIVTWRARDLTLRCLEHLAPQCAAGGHRLIVVDNASGDGTVEAVADRFPDARLIEMEDNVGFGRAANAGAAAGTGEAVVLVNNDVFVRDGFVEALVAPLREREALGAVAGMTLQPGGDDGDGDPGADVVDGYGIELDATLTAYNRLRHRAPDAPAGVLAGPSGGAAAYRRAAWDQVGGFDDRLFAYGEDVDLALRLRLAGWEAAAAPDARGVHLGGATTGIDSPLQRRLAGFQRGFLLRRYGILRSRAGLRALAFEALIVAYGLARFRTPGPLQGRIAGWRAARGARLPVPAGAVDRSITAREQLRRARHER
jgi:N-acetylglucosaminyl-diphospho-decaprenol L-rhamnosyltransferase